MAMPLLILTDSAKNRIRTLLKENNKECLRFGVEGGGCSGFQYFLELDSLENKDPSDGFVSEDDVKVIVDGPSLLYVIGTTIDWTNDLMGSHFTFKSPQAASKCGCGTSVNFKVEK